jgi:hypothetical protein
MGEREEEGGGGGRGLPANKVKYNIEATMLWARKGEERQKREESEGVRRGRREEEGGEGRGLPASKVKYKIEATML